MPATRSLQLRALFELAFAVTTVLLAYAFTREHILRSFILPSASIGRLCDGTAETPYQYRILIPLLIRWIHDSQLLEFAFPTRFSLAHAFGWASVIGLVYTQRALLAPLLPGPYPRALVSLGVFALLPFQFLFPRNWPYYYPWDLPATLCIALGLLLLRERRWWWYYPVFALGTLNRETSCFLVLLTLLTQWSEMPRARLMLHLVAQTILWWTIKLAVERAYQSSLGLGVFHVHALRDNLIVLQSAANWRLLASCFGFLWIPLLALGWRIDDDFSRRALWVMPAFLLMALCCAQIDELRIYGELIPVVLSALTALACSLIAAARARRAQ